MTLTIGVAIPGYIRHLKYLEDVLDSLEEGTVKPDKVVMSLSSIKEPVIVSKKYSFPLEIITSESDALGGTNRNIAKKHLDTDIISFIDMDDKAHPQRIEFLKRAFEENPELGCVVHSGVMPNEFYSVKAENKTFNLVKEGVEVPYGYHCIRIDTSKYPKEFVIDHTPGGVFHGHPTVRASFAKMVDYKVDTMHAEDLFFIQDLHKMGVKVGYLDNRLSYYRPHE